MDTGLLTRDIGLLWDAEIVPQLSDYIRIPNISPLFDPEWQAHGHMDRAVDLMAGWARHHIEDLPGAVLEIVRLPGRTPVILIEIPGTDGRGASADCVLLYGHLDKQPEMTGWSEGLGPWTPVLKGDRLYGRGAADDGYAIYGSVAALLALRHQGIPHARCVVLIEACEESGSYDLPFYVEHLRRRIGTPSLVVCLDSGCGDYERLWLTTSLRGIAAGTLSVRVLSEGVHSGDASGIVPSSFRLLRHLLSRLEDEASGRIIPAGLHVDIPAQRLAQAARAADILGDAVFEKFPFPKGMRPVAADRTELVLNRTWRPQLAVTGIAGLPPLASAGNVLRPFTTAKLSLRLPPTLDPREAVDILTALLTADPPYGAEIRFEAEPPAGGWNAPALSPWLEDAVAAASRASFGREPAYMGEGGTIPFMGMLGATFPEAQFLITGVLGPHSNAHGPNEFLDIPTGKRVTAVVSHILASHARQARTGISLTP